MRVAEILGWAAAAAVAAGLSAAAALAPPAIEVPLPPPLPRATTDDERAQVQRAEQTLRAHLQALQQALGRAPTLEELGDLGVALDVPWGPALADVERACPPISTGADWAWCPETGAVAPLAPPEPPEGVRP